MIKLKIISPVKEVLSEEVELLELPGKKGRFEVLEDHAPLITSLAKGQIMYKKRSERQFLDITGGFAEIRDNVVTVCVD